MYIYTHVILVFRQDFESVFDFISCEPWSLVETNVALELQISWIRPK